VSIDAGDVTHGSSDGREVTWDLVRHHGSGPSRDRRYKLRQALLHLEVWIKLTLQIYGSNRAMPDRAQGRLSLHLPHMAIVVDLDRRLGRRLTSAAS
jgi:hypothetical protein